MAAGQGYIEFSTGDILTAAAANGYLASQVVMVFASSAARSSAVTSPQEGMMSYLKDTNSVEYYSGSAWTPVSAGGGGGGKVLQVVQATSTTDTTVSSTTYTDSGLSASITPTVSTSKVLVLVNQATTIGNTSTGTSGGAVQIVRDSTAVFVPTNKYDSIYYSFSVPSGSLDMRSQIALSYLDSPATTSATTYKTQGAVYETTNGKYIRFQNTNAKSFITLIEIGA